MSEIPNIMDIDEYCVELSNITKLDVNKIKFIVLVNLTNMYSGDVRNFSFTDAAVNIETDIIQLLNTKPKTRGLALA